MDLLGERRGGEVEYHIGAEAAAPVMITGPGGRDHPQPRFLREGQRARADAAGRAADDHGVAGANAGPVMQGDERGRRRWKAATATTGSAAGSG